MTVHMNRRAQARALMAAGASVVALAGCSSLIGLDDFQDAPSAGGSAGAGASGGTSPTGGAAGVAGGGGAAGAGGVAGTGGGSGGSGGTGATGGAAGAGGTGGSGPKVNCAATGSPEVLIPKAEYPKESVDLVLASDLQSATPSAYVFVDHDWQGQPPSGRTNSEVVGVRVGQDGKVMGNGVKWWDVESPIRLDDAIKLQNSAGAPLVVRGNRKSVEQLTIPLNAAGNFVAGANGLAQMNLVTFAPQSKCTVTGGDYLTSKFSTAQTVNFAAVCGDAATRSLQVGTETGVPYTLVTSQSTASVDATQYVVPQSGHSLLLQSNGGFRVGTSFQDLANSPQFIDLGLAASQQVMGFFPTKTGALALLRRIDTLGVVNLFAATLTSPYTNIKGSPVTALPEVEPPITTGRIYLHIGQTVRIATMATLPDNGGQRWVRVIVANEGGEITYQGNVVNASSDLDGTAIAPLSTTGDQWLLVWRISKGPVLGQTIVCKAI